MPYKDPEKARQRKREYYLAHKEQWRERGRQYRERNREKVNAESRAYYAKHKEEHKRAVYRWRENHPGRALDIVRDYQARHRERFLENARDAARRRYAIDPSGKNVRNYRRRATKLRAPGRGVTREEWLSRLAEFGHRCAYCGSTGRLTQDHVDPIARGGAHEIENVVPACKRCNSSKCDRSLVFWIARRSISLVA